MGVNDNKETDTQILISALRILSNDIQSDDGVANAVINEAADRLTKLLELVGDVYGIVENHGENNAKFYSNWKQNWLQKAQKYGANQL